MRPKPAWKRVIEFVVVLAGFGVGSYFFGAALFDGEPWWWGAIGIFVALTSLGKLHTRWEEL